MTLARFAVTIIASIAILISFADFNAWPHSEDWHEHGEGTLNHDVNGFADDDHSKEKFGVEKDEERFKPARMTEPHYHHWVDGQPAPKISHRLGDDPPDHGNALKDGRATHSYGYTKCVDPHHGAGFCVDVWVPPDHHEPIKIYKIHSHKLKPGHEHDPQPSLDPLPDTSPKPVNISPTFSGKTISSISAVVGSAISEIILPEATDPDGDDSKITYSVQGLPSGFGFNSDTRALIGTPAKAGAASCTYKAIDERLGAATLTFSITISAAPESRPPPADNEPQQPAGEIQQPIVETPQDTTVSVVPSDDSNTQSEQQSEPDPEPVEEQDWVYTETVGRIGFSELMFASRGGLHSRPQWIELYNNSDSLPILLSNCKLVIESRDGDGVHRYVEVKLKNLIIEPESTILIPTWKGENSGFSENEKYNFWINHYTELEQDTHRNMVLGLSGFYLRLESRSGIVIDEAGNLDGDRRTQDLPAWELSDTIKDIRNRVSLVRRYDVAANMPLDGKLEINWQPASTFTDSSDRYWGRQNDIGTPGYRDKNKALPVELAYFNAKLLDSNVIVTWSTESELNNAGFNILRSKNIDYGFRPVNTSLILGQGTTSNKTEYSWNDKTAKPNTQYYYRIQEVSFDGQVQEISQVRMKGYLSPTNKLITNWGSIKRQ